VTNTERWAIATELGIGADFASQEEVVAYAHRLIAENLRTLSEERIRSGAAPGDQIARIRTQLIEAVRKERGTMLATNGNLSLPPDRDFLDLVREEMKGNHAE